MTADPPTAPSGSESTTSVVPSDTAGKAADSTTSKPGRGTDLVPPTPLEAKYVAVQKSPEFQSLRKRYRGWVFPVTAAALIWYLGFVILAAYAPTFMARPVWGNINLGLVLGFAQFATTFLITGLYIRYAGRVLDPASKLIREKMEKEGLQ
jgi:uncharacterized membrane protein (DUF485 family)